MPCGLDNKKITSIVQESETKLGNIEKELKNIFIKNLKNI
jgi:lipoate-protein ligase B